MTFSTNTIILGRTDFETHESDKYIKEKTQMVVL